MDLGIDLQKPFIALCIHIREGIKGSAWPEVVSQVFDGILYFALSLCTIGITESYNYTIILREAHELSVEPGFLSFELAFKDDLFHVVIKDCICVSTKEVKGIEVHADHISCADVSGEFCIPHPGVPKDHAEGIQFSPFPVNIDVSKLSEVHLRLLSRIGFIPVDCQDLPVISHGPAVLLHKGI